MQNGHPVSEWGLFRPSSSFGYWRGQRRKLLQLTADLSPLLLPDVYKLAHQSNPDVAEADEAQGQKVLHEVQGENVPAKE